MKKLKNKKTGRVIKIKQKKRKPAISPTRLAKKK
jgi:hypothetical protein